MDMQEERSEELQDEQQAVCGEELHEDDPVETEAQTAPEQETGEAEEPEVDEVDDGGDDEEKKTVEQLRKLEKMVTQAVQSLGDGINNVAGWVRKTLDEKMESARAAAARQPEDDPFVKIEKLSHLRDIGAITLEEFNNKKAELLKQI